MDAQQAKKKAPEPIDANALLDALGVAVFSIDGRTGELISANDAFARMFGYDSPEQAVGESVFGHYADPAERREAFARFLGDPAVRERGYVRLEAKRLVRGSDVPISILMTVLLRFDDQGKLFRLDGTAENIDERKRAEKAFQDSEERFRVVFAESAIGMAITEPSGRIVRVNEAFCRLTGRSQDDLLNESIQSLLHPDEDPATLLQLGDRSEVRERRFVHCSGDHRWGYVSVCWLHDDEGAAHSAVVMVQDVTAKRRAEMALARVERLESLGALAGGLAHDFNNLLTAIVGNISLAELRLAGGPPQLCEILAEARKAGGRASELTRQLMSLAKGGTPVRKTVRLMELITEGARFCLRGSTVVPRLDIDPDLWLVDCDEDQINQLLHNLVLNAKQAQPVDNAIRISARNATIVPGGEPPLEPGRYVEVTVDDRGCGIEVEHLAQIFDPYFSTKTGGSGLGLTSVHSIIRKHGGHVDVVSRVGAGTTFTVYLPASAAKAPPESTRRPLVSAPSSKLSGRVLVMDDQKTVRTVASLMLQEIGLEVDVVEHGEAAVSAYDVQRQAGRRYDLVILDLTIPGGMGGAETIRRLRELDSDVRALVSSGYSDDPVVKDFKKHGFIGAVPKPYTIAEVAAALQRFLPAR